MSKSSKSASWLSSVFSMTCPRCREGEMFPTGSFSFTKPFEMHDHCPVCKQNYMPEPGFYYGAMFISYILWGWFSILLTLYLVFVAEWSVNGAFALLLFVSSIFFVWLFRFSRSLWIHITVRYRGPGGVATEANGK